MCVGVCMSVCVFFVVFVIHTPRNSYIPMPREENFFFLLRTKIEYCAFVI